MDCKIKDFKVDVLPTRGAPNARYYVPNGNGTDIDEYVTDKSGLYRRVSSSSSSSGSGSLVSKEQPAGAINGSNAIFTLDFTPLSGTDHVYINGLLMEEGDDYTITNNIITFIGAAIPMNGWKVRVSYYK